MMRLPYFMFAAGLFGALPAAAQIVDTARARLEIAGQAPAACVIQNARASGGINASYAATGASAGEIRITDLVDPQTAQPRQAEITVTLPIVCNAAHRLTLMTTNGGLLRDGGNARNRQSSNSFGELVGYSLNAGWASRTLALDTNIASAVSVSVPDGTAGDLSFLLSVPPGGGPLVAGRYADTVIIELQVSS